MVARKKPIGEEYTQFVERWKLLDHQGKVNLANEYEVSYETAKAWVSHGDTPTRLAVPKQERSFTEPEVRSNVPVRLNTGQKMTTTVVLGDTHNPYQDNATLAAVERFLGDFQPNFLIYNGDINDFYQVSVFDKDPDRLGKLQSDLDVTTDMFARHSALMPMTTKVFVEGTHENRWFKYLRLHAPALAHLNSTNITELYKLKEFEMTYVPFERGLLINDLFLVLHGDIVSIHSSYTAKRHYEKHGGCGICNHTHRGGSYYKRDMFGTWGWWENFCLCQLNPDWIQNPDWTQGFSVIYFLGDRFWVEQVPIIKSQFIYGGKLY